MAAQRNYHGSSGNNGGWAARWQAAGRYLS